MMSEDQANDDLASMTDGKFVRWMAENGYQEGTQSYNLLSSMRNALLTATRTTEQEQLNKLPGVHLMLLSLFTKPSKKLKLRLRKSHL